MLRPRLVGNEPRGTRRLVRGEGGGQRGGPHRQKGDRESAQGVTREMRFISRLTKAEKNLKIKKHESMLPRFGAAEGEERRNGGVVDERECKGAFFRCRIRRRFRSLSSLTFTENTKEEEKKVINYAKIARKKRQSEEREEDDCGPS